MTTAILSSTLRSTPPSPLARLVADLDAAARRPSPQEAVAAVADALRPHLGVPDLLTAEQRLGDPAGYRQHLLHVAPDGAFSLVALVWLPGQATPVHDHVAWCVVGVHEGAEHEVRYRLQHGWLVPTATAVNELGSVDGLVPPGDIHLVRNEGDGLAISLHVYGADLRLSTTSIRRRYDAPVLATPRQP